MVPIDRGAYLIDFMRDMGPTASNGWGFEPRPDGAIIDYFRGRQIDLEPVEFRIIRKMCAAFCDGLRTGKQKFCIPPIQREAPQEDDVTWTLHNL